MKKLKLRDTVDLPISSIRTSELNPNVMSEFEFSQLVESIKDVGFDEPIKVIPDPEEHLGTDEKMYVVVSGEHRLRAADYLDFETIPCVIETNWDTQRASAELVRRNIIKGSIEPRKLRNLLETDFGVLTREEQARVLGYENEEALRRAARLKEEESMSDLLDVDIDDETGTQDVEMEFIDGLHSMLASIFSQYGTDVDANFIAFMLKRRLSLLVKVTSDFQETFEEFVAHVRNEGLEMNEVLQEALSNYLEARN